jgi:hypothetical protein
MMIGQLTLKNATQCLTNSSQQEAVFGKSLTMTWKIPKNLPRKRKDNKFDKLLHTLRLLEKRRYVSQLWLLFCKARGILPPPVYKFENVNQLLAELEKCINVPKVVQEAQLIQFKNGFQQTHMLEKLHAMELNPRPRHYKEELLGI